MYDVQSVILKSVLFRLTAFIVPSSGIEGFYCIEFLNHSFIFKMKFSYWEVPGHQPVPCSCSRLHLPQGESPSSWMAPPPVLLSRCFDVEISGILHLLLLVIRFPFEINHFFPELLRSETYYLRPTWKQN